LPPVTMTLGVNLPPVSTTSLQIIGTLEQYQIAYTLKWTSRKKLSIY
jgi:hypothetical protein